MNSRFLEVLDRQIASSTGTLHGQFRAEKAAYLARAGFLVEAKEEITSIRTDRILVADSRVSTLLNLAEGLYLYYKDVSPLAEDRFARARAIAQVGGHADLEGQAISWLSLIHYGNYRFNAICKCIEECVEQLACTDSTANARISLTIAISIHLANRFDLAMPWYRRTHLFAVERRDEAMISAMLHNMAALWLSNSRNAQLGGPATVDSSRQALTGALSSFNFDGLVGVSALGVLTPLLEAQISSLELDYHKAIRLYEDCRSNFDVQNLHNWSNWMLADLEWCRLNAGLAETTCDALEKIQRSIGDSDQADEKAVTFARLAECARFIGEHDWAIRCDEAAKENWRHFGKLQESILNSLLTLPALLKLQNNYPL